MNGQLKLKFNFLNNSYLGLAIGPESNKTLQHYSNASVFNLDAYLEEINFSNLFFDAKLNGEYLKLNLNRKNTDLELLSNFKLSQAQDNFILFNFGYKTLNRDFLLSLLDKAEDYQIESRAETNIRANLQISYTIIQRLYLDINLGLSNISVSRNYRYEQENNLITKVRRDLQDFQFNITSNVLYKSKPIVFNLGINYSSRQELNTITPKFSISDNDLLSLRTNESQRDNYSSRTKITAKNIWNITPHDTLRLEQLFSILQYDTPSKLNNDDRDEFTSISGLYYSRYFSEQFLASITIEFLQNHLVYLKKERSAMNNWNKILRLSSNFNWNNNLFSINPQFEILANYTIFDFEDIQTNIKSYSFRQIAYRDTLCIYLTNSLSLQAQIILKYFERGILIWKYFKESPQNSNFEQNIRTILFNKSSENFSYGAGIRFFQTNLRNLQPNVFSTSLAYRTTSLSPEAILMLQFNNGNKLVLTCGYEFQNVNNSTKLQIPNASLYSVINF